MLSLSERDADTVASVVPRMRKKNRPIHRTDRMIFHSFVSEIGYIASPFTGKLYNIPVGATYNNTRGLGKFKIKGSNEFIMRLFMFLNII